MKQSHWTSSDIIVGVTCLKYSSSIASYLRFKAKNHGFYTKNLRRKEKYKSFLKRLNFLLAGPVIVFHANGIGGLDFIEILKGHTDLNIVFLLVQNVVILSDSLVFKDSLIRSLANISLSFDTKFNGFNLDYVLLDIVNLLDAYNKSVIKRN